MSKKKGLAGLDALKAIGEVQPTSEKKPIPIAGLDASQKAMRETVTRKTRQVGMRLGGTDLDLLEDLAIKLKKHGLQYSEANAVRLALRLFKGKEQDIAQIAQQIKEEDGRKRRTV